MIDKIVQLVIAVGTSTGNISTEIPNTSITHLEISQEVSVPANN